MSVFKIWNGSKWIVPRSFVVWGTCATASATVAKVVTISGYDISVGDIIGIKFTLGNSVSSPTLNINGTGAKNIKLGSTNASTTTMTVGANGFVLMCYTGTSFQLMGSHRTSDATVSVASQTEIDNGTATAKYVRPDRLKIMLDGKGYQTETQVDAKISDYDQYIASQGYQTSSQVQDAISEFQDYLEGGDIVVDESSMASSIINARVHELIRIWKGTQAQYDALNSTVKNNASYIFFIKG